MPASRLRAFVFDAYGTLFDVASLAPLAERHAPGRGSTLLRLWRAKQLEGTWLAGLMRGPRYRRPDFQALTEFALDYALAALALPLGDAERESLCDGWLGLAAYDDAAPTLDALAPHPRWILSNGTLSMLDPLVVGSPLATRIDGVLSVDDADAYKPAPAVYALAADRLGLPPASIGFVSANGWDAAGAQAFGFETFWINRLQAPAERHAPPPTWIVGSLGEVAAIARRA
jgi:2-haloacid dehalogenase